MQLEISIQAFTSKSSGFFGHNTRTQQTPLSYLGTITSSLQDKAQHRQTYPASQALQVLCHHFPCGKSLLPLHQLQRLFSSPNNRRQIKKRPTQTTNLSQQLNFFRLYGIEMEEKKKKYIVVTSKIAKGDPGKHQHCSKNFAIVLFSSSLTFPSVQEVSTSTNMEITLQIHPFSLRCS